MGLDPTRNFFLFVYIYTLLKVVSYYDSSVPSVVGFQNKSLDGGGWVG